MSGTALTQQGSRKLNRKADQKRKDQETNALICCFSDWLAMHYARGAVEKRRGGIKKNRGSFVPAGLTLAQGGEAADGQSTTADVAGSSSALQEAAAAAPPPENPPTGAPGQSLRARTRAHH